MDIIVSANSKNIDDIILNQKNITLDALKEWDNEVATCFKDKKEGSA